ncbi:hypothetical protein Maes01_02584 [Microbulbifer aestuariivivens]|uniref:Uncharacterized protein n=1 Tax=Microbulbifer aestuariivivens TaxID=1908308 RepID=A0ABP9WSG3_9GAMM
MFLISKAIFPSGKRQEKIAADVPGTFRQR